MADAEAIARLERLSASAWPSLETVTYDGWWVRFSDGYTKRANSVIPFRQGTIPIEEKVAECERMYSERGLDTTFKLTAASMPAALDEFLDGRGYARESPAVVHTLAMKEGALSDTGKVVLAPEVSRAWLDPFCMMSGLDERKKRTAERMLGAIASPKRFACLQLGEQIVACGLGVLEDESVWLFDIVTREDQRRRGHGTSLVQGLLSWGRQNEARRAYLQVASGNEPALNLYRGLGFREAYGYWYRVRRSL